MGVPCINARRAHHNPMRAGKKGIKIKGSVGPVAILNIAVFSGENSYNLGTVRIRDRGKRAVPVDNRVRQSNRTAIVVNTIRGAVRDRTITSDGAIDDLGPSIIDVNPVAIAARVRSSIVGGV